MDRARSRISVCVVVGWKTTQMKSQAVNGAISLWILEFWPSDNWTLLNEKTSNLKKQWVVNQLVTTPYRPWLNSSLCWNELITNSGNTACYSGIDTESNKQVMIILSRRCCLDRNPEEQLEEWKAASSPFVLECYDMIVDGDDVWVDLMEWTHWI